MSPIRLDTHGRPTAFAATLADAALVVGGSSAMLLAGLALLTMAVPQVDADVPGEVALAQAHRVADHIEDYRRLHGTVPDTLDMVYGRAVPRDPWGQPWMLRRDGEDWHLISYGADGLPGGSGADADIALGALEAALGRDPLWSRS